MSRSQKNGENVFLYSKAKDSARSVYREYMQDKAMSWADNILSEFMKNKNTLRNIAKVASMRDRPDDIKRNSVHYLRGPKFHKKMDAKEIAKMIRDNERSIESGGEDKMKGYRLITRAKGMGEKSTSVKKIYDQMKKTSDGMHLNLRYVNGRFII